MFSAWSKASEALSCPSVYICRGMHLGLGLDLDVGVLIMMDGSCFVLPYMERSMMMCLPGQYRCLLYVKSFLGMSVSAF